MKKISNLLMMALLAIGMGLTSCDEQLDNAVVPGVTPGTDEQGEVTSITVDLSKIDEKYLDTEKTKLQLTVGDEVTLSFTILPEEMASTEVELTAADATILSIDGLKVKALKEGETKVTAKAGEKTAECTVTVKAATVAVTSVTLDKTELALTVGDAAVQLTATVTPDNATDADVDWSSSDVSVATVDGSGLVTAVADGTATITAKAGEKTAECKVTVSKKAAAAKTLAEATSEDIGKIAGKDGKIYATKADAEAVATGNAVAKIIYVGSSTGDATYNHGLALALTDESSSGMGWNNAKTACTNKNTSATVESASWMLPSKDQWNKMIDACKNVLGTKNDYQDLKGGFSGITGASNLQSGVYWSSTEFGSDNAWYFHFRDGNWGQGYKGNGNMRVRSCLAF